MKRLHDFALGLTMTLVLLIALGMHSISSASPTHEQLATLTVPQGTVATLVVTSTANAGPGSLRQALLDAVSGDTITFDPAVFPPTSPMTIALTSALPDIIQGNLTIDGSNAGVILDGKVITQTLGSGFIIKSANNTIRGLQIVRFPYYGIEIWGWGSGQSNVIGGDRTVGSGPMGQGNLISGNGANGLQIVGSGATNNTVTGNYIGTDASGTGSVTSGTYPPYTNGIFVGWDAADNRIGGSTPGERNVIAGGVTIGPPFSPPMRNRIIGNYIGVNATGTSSLGRSSVNLISLQGVENIIGGTAAGEGNVIGGNNGGDGIQIRGSNVVSNVVIGNYIGTNANGTAALGNAGNGVFMGEGASYNRVGGSMPGEGNLISGNGGNGVSISGTTTLANTIIRNSIHANTGLGIDDVNGGNRELTPPVITRITGGNIVTGTACANCTVEVFSDAAEEGRIYEGSTTADASGVFTFTKASNLTGPYVTATATDHDGNTSEFSAPQRAWATTLDVCPTCTFTTIQAAINAATDGDTIRVALGTYTGTMSAPGTGTPFTATVLIAKNLTLLGGFNADFSQRDPQAYTTTIDGQFRPWSVVAMLGCRATVDGFSIVNGRAPDAGSGMWIGNWLGNSAVVTVSNNVVAYNKIVTDTIVTANGAGILVTQGATASILNNRIFSNAIEGSRWRARPVAGLGVVSGATAVISGNQILSNTVFFGNGGVGVSFATAQIINNIVQGNSGSGIDITGSPSALIQGNTVVSNTALWNGGGILAGNSVVTITDNLIAYNVPFGDEGGGGVFLYGSSWGLIRQNQILFNQANRGGGVMVIWGASGFIEGNTVAYNRATYSGGGIEVRQSGVVTISHNAVFSNVAREQGSINIRDLTTPTVIDGNDVRNNQITGESYWGGGINVENVSQPVTLTNNVVVSNHNRGVRAANVSLTAVNNTIARNGAMGIEVFRWPVTQTVPYTTTLANNVVGDHTDCGISAWNGIGVIIDYNDVWNSTTNYCDLASPPSGTHNISADPQFVNPTAGDYHLRFGSPALNAGTSVGAPAYDKDGVARPQGRGVDMGAYEVVVYDVYLPLAVKNH